MDKKRSSSVANKIFRENTEVLHSYTMYKFALAFNDYTRFCGSENLFANIG